MCHGVNSYVHTLQAHRRSHALNNKNAHKQDYRSDEYFRKHTLAWLQKEPWTMKV